jgi:hypothetical protein
MYGRVLKVSMVATKLNYQTSRIPLCSEYYLGIGIAEVAAVDVHDRANFGAREETIIFKHGVQSDVLVWNITHEVEGVGEHGIRASDVDLAGGPTFGKEETLAS